MCGLSIDSSEKEPIVDPAPKQSFFHKEAQELEEGSLLGWLGELRPLAESTRPYSNFRVTRRKHKSYKVSDVHSGPEVCDKSPLSKPSRASSSLRAWGRDWSSCGEGIRWAWS